MTDHRADIRPEVGPVTGAIHWRPECSCGWRGPVLLGAGSEAQAVHEAREHERTAPLADLARDLALPWTYSDGRLRVLLGRRGMEELSMDHYEAQSIAENAAERAASDVRREIGYELDSLRDEIRSLRRELDEERSVRREADSTLDAMIGNLS